MHKKAEWPRKLRSQEWYGGTRAIRTTCSMDVL
jgi:hypothetical protein